MRFNDKKKDDNNTLNLHEGHRNRIRERLGRNNFAEADDYQVLEYILTLVIKRRDTNELAHTLISQFGSLAKVFNAEEQELQKVKGITPTISFFLHSLPFIYRNYKMSMKQPKVNLSCPRDVFNYLGDCIYHLPQEEFYIICLDSGKNVINHKIVAIGGNSQVAILYREIVRFAVNSNASSVVFLHNHPNASANPSEEDIETTRRLFMSLHVENIDVFDHVIVSSDESFYSFAHDGQLSKFQEEANLILNFDKK